MAEHATSFTPVGELENRDRLRGVSPDNLYDRGSSPSLEADGYESADSGSSILNEIPCHPIEDGKIGANPVEENLHEDEFQPAASSPSYKQTPVINFDCF